MNSYQRVHAVLSGTLPDRVPCIPMIREWASKQVGLSLHDVIDNPQKYVYSQYFCSRELGYDSVSDLNAVNAEVEAMGCVLKDKDISVQTPVIDDYTEDLRKIRIVDPTKDGRLPVILEGVRRLRELCGGEKAIVGYVQAPFRAAAMVRGVERFLKDCLRDRENVLKLLQTVTYNQIIYGISLVHAGADIIEISDPMSSGDVVLKKQYRELGFAYSCQLIKALKTAGAMIIHHACGNTADRLDLFKELGADALSLDQAVDMEEARRIVGDGITLFGNVSPLTLLNSGAREVASEAERCIEKAGENGAYILSSGCLISADTPIENMRAMADTAKTHLY